MLVINDRDTCWCGAYYEDGSRCANGHWRVDAVGRLYKFYIDVDTTTDGGGYLDGPNYVVAGSLEEAAAYARSWAAGFYSDVAWRIHLIDECNSIGALRADWGKEIVFHLVREDVVKDVKARLEWIQEGYGEWQDGDDLGELQEEDIYQLGYIAGLRDALRWLVSSKEVSR